MFRRENPSPPTPLPRVQGRGEFIRRELFTHMGKQLSQRAIHFEVREAGEIIDLDGPEE